MQEKGKVAEIRSGSRRRRMARKRKAGNQETTTDMPISATAPSDLGESELETHKTAETLPVVKEASKVGMIIRRSERLQNSSHPAQNQDTPIVFGPITVTENLGEDQPNLDESESESEPLGKENSTEQIHREKSLEEKVAHLIKEVQKLKSKVAKRGFSGEGSSEVVDYKSLYIDCQKEIQSLSNENGQLRNQLKIACAKIEVYENLKIVFDKVKEFMESNLAKADATMNLSSQAMFTGFSFPNASAELGPVASEEPTNENRPKKGGK